jgi:hypothetical protein
MDNVSFGYLLWVALVSGIIGTLGMTLFLWLVTRSGYAGADLVRVIGSLFTRRQDNSFRLGITIHIINGIIFAVAYTLILVMANVTTYLFKAGIGISIGFLHGAVFSFLLVVAVSEHHPVEKFRNTGFAVAVAYVAAHCIYGFLVASVASGMGL